MSAPARLAGFAAALAVLFGGAALAGNTIDPDRGEPRTTHDQGAEEHVSVPTRSTHGGDHPVRGLAIAQDGLRILVDDPELRRGTTERLRFRVIGRDGKTVRDFDLAHEKRMHLIVARRDLSGFQHLHPRQAADGSWSMPLRLPEAGSYRLFADFTHEGKPATLATDLRVDGAADLRALPATAPTAASDGGYLVRLETGRARPGVEADLRFTIAKDGHAVHTEPYLGAGGHLVALREGDLAFLHVHPTEHGHDKQPDEHDDSVGFAATFPTAGRYRLFMQFKHEGRVQTVAFTQEVR